MLDCKQGIGADLSGVLFEDAFPKVVGRYEKEYGLYEGALQNAKNKHLPPFFLDDIESREFWRRVFGEVGIQLTDDQIDDLDQKVIEESVPYNSLKTIQRLKPKYVLGLLTNSPRKWFEDWDKKYGLSEIFDITLPSYKVRMRKPEHLLMRYFIFSMGLPANMIDFHDDKICNVEAGTRAGMNARQSVPGVDPFLEYDTNGR